MKLYLVRHGQSTGNVGGTLMGQSDHPLTALGKEQARAAAARLAPFGPMPVHASDLPRALATARAILDAWSVRATPGGPLDAAVRARPQMISDARLREIDLGDYEGRSWEEFEADAELAASFAADPYGTALPNGESLRHLEARVLAAVRDVLAAHGAGDGGELTTQAVVGADASATAVAGADDDVSPGATGAGATRPGQHACIVAHDGPIRAILNHYLGVPPQKWWTLSTSHGGVSLLEFSDGWVNVRFVNATDHLSGLEPGAFASVPGAAG